MPAVVARRAQTAARSCEARACRAREGARAQRPLAPRRRQRPRKDGDDELRSVYRYFRRPASGPVKLERRREGAAKPKVCSSGRRSGDEASSRPRGTAKGARGTASSFHVVVRGARGGRGVVTGSRRTAGTARRCAAPTRRGAVRIRAAEGELVSSSSEDKGKRRRRDAQSWSQSRRLARRG